MIDVELDCGWRVVGTTTRPCGVQVLDEDGNVVKGIKRVAMTFDPTGFPAISVEMLPKLESRSMDPPAQICGRVMVGSGTDTYDPSCELSAGHSGSCKSSSATDQHKL